MCGIIGIVSDGKTGAREVLIRGLERLEYRGYDSAGIALVDEATAVYKVAGRVAGLRDVTPEGADAGTGIAHTRWATHGPPSKTNAHPHKDCNGKVVLVHNGIIENYGRLKDELLEKGHKFVSDTDTEVVAHLFEENLKAAGNLTLQSATQAFRQTVARLDGAYAIVVSVAGLPQVVFGARHAAPLLVGRGDSANYLASDATAIVEHTKKVQYLEEGDLVVATPTDVQITDIDGKQQTRQIHEVDWDVEAAQKGGYPHYMLKEIHDGPRAINDALTGRLHPTPPHVRLETGIPEKLLRDTRRVLVLACGTSLHAGMVGKHAIERLVGLPVDVANSSEYRYSPTVREAPLLAIAVSQSGETADTLAAVREAKSRGHKVIALTNVVGSSLAREADGVLYIRSGPEIGVAATKSFLGQLTVFYLLALQLAEVNGTLSGSQLREYARELQHMPRLIQQVLQRNDAIETAGRAIMKGAHSCFYLGRQNMHPVAMEGALKIKEIAYIHAEGFSGGELKHGPFALLTKETPVVALLSPDHVYDKMVSNVIEVKARGPTVFLLTTDSDEEADKIGDHVIRTPDCDPLFLPLVHSAALHLFSYWAADEMGCEIDMPRNLAKSVTVE